MKLENKHIETLMLIGKTQIIESNQNDYLSQSDNINRLSPQIWNVFFNELSDNNIIKLFKGIVLTEKTLKWTGGSVAGGIWIYKEIERRKIDNDYQIANWALMTTNNPYIPFGSINHSKKNVVDYFLMKQEFSHKQEVEKITKEKRLLENQISGIENTVVRLKNNITELKERLEFSKLSGNALGSKIVSDNNHPVYYYYNEIEKLLRDKSVEKKLLKSILKKFKEKEKKNIKLLKNRLIEEINNR